ncbi:MAG TPA: MG2 domain-containing protein, partial [Anaerolineales bacterium]|nr:MG2 domain-containing protein [Anaerolineales bacterium]
PGMYIFNMKTGDLLNGQLILLISRYALAVKQAEGELTAWLTDINATDTASNAVTGADIFVYARDGRLIRQGTTDEDGLYRTSVSQNPEPLIVVAQIGDDFTAAGLSWEWNSVYGAWWGWWRPAPQTRTFSAHIFTDRPIYKPGQTVYFKAVIRRDQDALLSLPAEGTPITVRIRDARNNVVTTMELLTSEFGTVNGEFAIAEGAMLGDYAVEVVWNDDFLQQIFKVQDYRKPDMQVTVTTDAPSYVEGDTITAHVDTRYFFGEPVPNADLTILKFVHSQGYYDWWADEYVEGEDWIKPWDSQPMSGRADENGQFTFTLPANIFWGRDEYYWDWRSSQERTTWGIEVTADDGSHQVVSGFGVVTVYAASEEISVDTGGYLKTPGEPFLLEAAVHDIIGNPVDGRALMVELRRWSSGSYDYTVIVQSAQMTTGPTGEASLNFIPEEPGYYQLRVSGTDTRGKPIEYRTWLYIFSEAAFWAREQTTNLQITAEQNTYTPGDTAKFLVESSFSGPALLTFERGTVREELPVQLTAPLTVLEIPIRADYAPNIFIVVNAYRELDTSLENQEYIYESIPDSQLLTASVEVQVPVTDKNLIITITPDKESYAPREEATFTIQVTNQNGFPVNAEVSLALVDEAIFSLSDELSGPILASFYDPRAHIVRTYDSLALRRILNSGGWGGGGGDGHLPGGPRSDFPDTAAWFPILYTDGNGEIIVTLTLPDTLTTWRLTVKATTGSNHKFGEATANFLTQQPIIVRPILPRTLTAGDQVLFSAMVHNYSGETQELQVALEQGEGGLLQMITPDPQTIALAPGEQQMVGWMVTALASGEANVTVTASIPAGGVGDAVQLTLPIRPLAIPDVTTLVGDFTGTFDTDILWPSDALGISTVKIELSRSVAGTLLTGLDYLTGFPYGCVEQTMSKALPNAVVGRAFYQLGVSAPTLQADLPAQINAGLQRLYGYQHNDGGWGWWYDDATHDYQTAWVVFGLSVTAQAGYEVDPGVIERGATWLNEHLAEMDVRTQAYALYALAIAEASHPSGHGNLEAAQSLYAASFAQLDTFSRAALALAFHELGETESARVIVDTLAESATERNGEVFWAGEDYDGYYYEKTMASATRSTALALSAFVQIRPNHPLEPGLVRWLMGQRTQHGWGTTNETSFAILALTDHLLAAEFATAQTTYQIELNGAVIASGQLGPGEPAVSLAIPADQLRAGTNDLSIRQTGNLPLYYVVNSRVYLPQSEIVAAGVVEVTRQVLDPATNKPLDTILPGQLVKVVLTVNLPDTASYMLVEDQLPGGLEALNENLNTTSHVADAVNEYGESYEVFFWRELGYNYKEIRADRITFFITEMGAGTHTFTYLARATHSGTFVAMPAEAYAMYDLATWGRSASNVVIIGE